LAVAAPDIGSGTAIEAPSSTQPSRRASLRRLAPFRPARRAATATGPTITHEMADAPLPDLVLYSRPGCHLCDEARELLQHLLDERRRSNLPTPTLFEINIESDLELERRFFTTIPVVELADRRLELATSAAKLRRLLSDVLDGSAATTPA
jgi:hypothetical protein